MRNAEPDESQAGIKIAGRNVNNLRHADETTLTAEEELKSLLMKVKEESGRAGLKLNIQKTKIMESSPTTSWQIDGETMETVTDFIFLGSKITADGDYSQEIKLRLLPGRKATTNLDSILKSKEITLPTNIHIVKAMAFPVVQKWEMDHKEGWAPKNWCFQIVVLEKTLESPLDGKEIKLVSCKGNQSWMFIGRTDAKVEAPILGHHINEELTQWKRPWCWTRLRQEKKGTTEDDLVGWHHQLNGHEFKQTLGDGEGQGSLECCSPRGHKESATTEQLNNK